MYQKITFYQKKRQFQAFCHQIKSIRITYVRSYIQSMPILQFYSSFHKETYNCLTTRAQLDIRQKYIALHEVQNITPGRCNYRIRLTVLMETKIIEMLFNLRESSNLVTKTIILLDVPIFKFYLQKLQTIYTYMYITM